jgi:hypothetical protein
MNVVTPVRNSETGNYGAGYVKYPNGIIGPSVSTEKITKLEPMKVYEIDEYNTGNAVILGLKECPMGEDFLPKKEIWREIDLKILKSIEERLKQNTQEPITAFFHGTKGMGKTTLANKIAVMAEAPIVMMNPEYSLSKQDELLNCTNNKRVVMILNESSQFNLKGDKKIEFFDKGRRNFRPIIILTANNDEGMDDRLRNRSRIIYDVFFEPVDRSAEQIRSIVEAYKIKQQYKVCEFIKNNFEEPTTDLITLFCDELKLWEYDKDTLLDTNTMAGILEYLNIKTSRNHAKYNPTMSKLMPTTTKEEIYNKILRSRPTLKEEEFDKLFMEAINGIENPKSYESAKKRAKRIYGNRNTFGGVDN